MIDDARIGGLLLVGLGDVVKVQHGIARAVHPGPRAALSLHPWSPAVQELPRRLWGRSLRNTAAIGPKDSPALAARRVRSLGTPADPRYGCSDHPGLIPANLTTLPHFSVSSAMSLPKSAGEPGSTVPPRSANRAFIFGSARAALISLFSFSTISAGVFLGAPMPDSPVQIRLPSEDAAAPRRVVPSSLPGGAACRL
jgi:hypothetical protein